ncbi:MAG: VOC family protein [Dehalococcoidia bacterium]
MANWAPNGWHSITPRLVVDDVGEQVAFLREAFGATGTYVEGRPAELKIGDSMVMVSGVGVREAMPASLYLYVEDADATFAKAVAAGATVIEEPLDTAYGDRRGMVRDRGGNMWQIATRKV